MLLRLLNIGRLRGLSYFVQLLVEIGLIKKFRLLLWYLSGVGLILVLGLLWLQGVMGVGRIERIFLLLLGLVLVKE